jgi:hypothetical protein
MDLPSRFFARNIDTDVLVEFTLVPGKPPRQYVGKWHDGIEYNSTYYMIEIQKWLDERYLYIVGVCM